MSVAVARISRRGGERRAESFAFTELRADGEFEGYASRFGVIDTANDVIAPGAFRRSLAARGPGRVKLLYQHLPHEPIGRWHELREDKNGLYVRGRLLTDVQRGREVLALIRAGALDGLSIGFRTIRARTDQRSAVRTIFDLDLWEISIVTFPMLTEARVTAVKQSRARPSPNPPMREKGL
ncbi:MAG: HK97 family phage prohead protease [Alphaproteobacteria bacterium]|nr:HK97 family phage prohead protease [Alphaproteobacteria bacterium]